MVAERRPAILFASPNGAAGLDFDYMRELSDAGFQIDYTDSLEELTPARIAQFNVLVLFATREALGKGDKGDSSSQKSVAEFNQTLDQYLAQGGGLLLMPDETNFRGQRLSELTDRWGARLPAEQIIEENPGNIAVMPHSAQGTRLAFTDQIAPSPVTTGVHGIWYPYEPAYFSAMTAPLLVDAHWDVPVRASATAITKAIDTSKVDTAPGLATRPRPERRPALLAIRTIGNGRLALLAEWRQFSIGSGTKWIFDREVLSRGLAGRPSDFGALLSNTFRWLAEPSAAGAALGGWRTRADHFQAPNASETVKARYRATPYDPSSVSHAPIDIRKVFRGLIGARTTYSAGHSNVTEYARAARAAGLDFVVFLEDFERMSPEKLDALTTDCSRASGPDLLLLPGFSITSNIGNHLFFFSPHPQWPPDSVLTGPQRSRLYIQEQTPTGDFTGYGTQFLNWVLGAYSDHGGQVGYYDFKDSPTGMRLYDARLYAMVGLRYYRKGRLVEDLLDAFLTAAASTSPPAPVAVDDVDSADQLAQEARSGHALTYAKAASLDPEARDGIVNTALRWSHQYDAMPIFVSSGPMILSWPECFRAMTYGAEGFAPERAVMNAWSSVTSDVGLDEIRIYDGDRLFRRIDLHGARAFEQLFVLDGSVQRNLVLVARDRRGGTAVAFPRRSWSDGTPAPVFCSDHINDCAGPLLAHGPWSLPWSKPPVLPADIGGWTWDGGPPAALPATGLQETLPELVAAEGAASASRLDPIPRLEFSDEGAVGVEAYGREAYDPRLLRVVNPWHTYGPIGGPAPVFENIQQFRQWVSASEGVPATGFAADGVRTGVSPALFTDIVRFRRESTVRSLRLARLHPPGDARVVVGGMGERRIVDMGATTSEDIALGRGAWFAVYGSRPMNAQLFENRGEPVRLIVHGLLDVMADVQDRRFRSGDQYTSEFSSLAFPLDKSLTTDQQIARYVDYLRDPKGLEVLRGTRAQSTGLLEIAVEDGAVQLSYRRPTG